MADFRTNNRVHTSHSGVENSGVRYKAGVEIKNLTSSAVDEKLLKKAMGLVLKGEGFGKGCEISLVFAGEDKIKTLNRRYKQADYSTDVLAFGDLGFGENFAGEAIVCLKEVEKNSRRFGGSFKKELARVVIHGILHLAGYGDSTDKAREVMRKKENFYLGELFTS